MQAGAKDRQCLKCGNVFASQGPGNRLCPKCAAAQPYMPAVASQPQATARGGLKSGQ